MLAISLAAALLIYTAGLARAWRRVGYGRGVRPIEAAAFVAGWLALAFAVSPAMHDWSETWLAAHMVQHELLMVVAAPLIVVSSPLVAALWTIPAAARQRMFDTIRRPFVSAGWNALTAPLTVFCLHGLALWIWHLPSLYDAALESPSLHHVQHACFFGTAALFWWGLAHGRWGRFGYGAAVFYVFATSLHGGVLGALLTFSPEPWYPAYNHQAHGHQDAHALALTPLEDQQLAGLLMWVPAGIILAACGLALFAAWLRESDRRVKSYLS
jgi:putative membrane protein